MYSKCLIPLFLCLLFVRFYCQDQQKTILSTFHSISSLDLMSDNLELSSEKYKAGYKTLSLYISGLVKPVYYHNPFDYPN